MRSLSSDDVVMGKVIIWRSWNLRFLRPSTIRANASSVKNVFRSTTCWTSVYRLSISLMTVNSSSSILVFETYGRYWISMKRRRSFGKERSGQTWKDWPQVSRFQMLYQYLIARILALYLVVQPLSIPRVSSSTALASLFEGSCCDRVSSCLCSGFYFFLCPPYSHGEIMHPFLAMWKRV